MIFQLCIVVQLFMIGLLLAKLYIQRREEKALLKAIAETLEMQLDLLLHIDFRAASDRLINLSNLLNNLIHNEEYESAEQIKRLIEKEQEDLDQRYRN